MSTMPSEIMEAARSASCVLAADYNGHVERIAQAILAERMAERERCASIADAAKKKAGSPVLGPYERGLWDMGERIAFRIRAEV